MRVLVACLFLFSILFLTVHSALATANNTWSTKAQSAPLPPITKLGIYGGASQLAAAAGDYVYAVEGNRMRVLSFAVPDTISIVGDTFVPTDTVAIGISPVGDRVWLVLNDPARLFLYDTSNPAAPVLIQVSNIPSEITNFASIAVSGNQVALLTGKDVLMYRLEEDALVLRGQAPRTVGGIGSVRIEGDVLVVLGNDVALYDIANDALPLYANTVTTEGPAFTLNNYLYVSNVVGQRKYVDIWDIHNPALVQLAGSIENYRITPVIQRDGRLIAYEGDQYTGILTLYDLSNPLVLQPIGRAESQYVSFRSLIAWTSPDSFYAVYHTEANLWQLAQIAITSPFTLHFRNYMGSRYSDVISVNDRYSYISGDYAGFEVYDMQNPAAPRRVGRVLENVEDFSIYLVADNTLYLQQHNGTMAIVDISNPLAPSITNTYTFPTGYTIQSVTNGYLYAAFPAQLLVLRLSDLSATTIAIGEGDGCSSIGVDYPLLLVRCIQEIQSFSIQNPTAPVCLPFTLPNEGVFTVDYPLVLRLGEDATLLYDFTTLGQPQLVSTIPNKPAAGGCGEFIRLRDREYLRRCLYKSDIVNLANPAAPRTTPLFPLVTDNDFVVQGNHLVAIDTYSHSYGIETWQINYPLPYPPVNYAHHQYLPLVGRP